MSALDGERERLLRGPRSRLARDRLLRAVVDPEVRPRFTDDVIEERLADQRARFLLVPPAPDPSALLP